MPPFREGLCWIAIGILVGLVLWQRDGKRLKCWLREGKQTVRRTWRLRPKRPEDCPCCQQGVTLRTVNATPNASVPPWCEVKGRGGRKKTISTQGFACPNTRCTYFNQRDATVHALVGDGVRGETDAIQGLRCQACGTRFSVRRDTALAQLKTDPERIELVLMLRAEGVSQTVLIRVFKHCEATVDRWRTRAGAHASLLHDLYFRNLELDYLQVDELYVNIRNEAGKHWVWASIAPRTKIVPSVHVGRRTTKDAQAFVHDITLRLAPGCIPLFTSDGLRQYFWALTAHFGHWVKRKRWRKPRYLPHPDLRFAQLKKLTRGRKLTRTITIVPCGTRQQVREHLQVMGYSGIVNTAFIERLNLTLRHLVAALARRTWSLAQTTDRLKHDLEWSRVYYHSVRLHDTLTLGREVPKAQRFRTPAMAAGPTDHRWTVLEILRLPLLAEGSA